ncbi:MAG: hypothetical protein ING29_00895 [Azospirillum sp.]|nr:hypothetical protein [Azospirillum sp.]
MKVAIGQRPHDGPWGGGNQFLSSLVAGLTRAGHEVVFDMAQLGIDLALLVDPRPRLPNVTFAASDIWKYRRRHPRLIAVHRVNECDARKGTYTMDLRLACANRVADHTVFISHWLLTLPIWRHMPSDATSVIENGADASIFRPRSRSDANGGMPLRLVTHHWGAHANKGGEIYAALAAMAERPDWSRRFTFTYVGNPPKNVPLRGARIVAPLSGEGLGAELRAHDAYVTGSLNEPAGMHHIEAALSGLPILFRRSGALPEYCEGYGTGFWGLRDLESALDAFLRRLETHRAALAEYPHTAERMVARYIRLFEDLVDRRDALIAARRPALSAAVTTRALELI